MMEFLPAELAPRSRDVEHQIVSTCAATITTVQTSLRAMQAAALDVRDAVTALRELYEHIEGLPDRPEADTALRGVLERGDALIKVFAVIGLYDPVPIDMI